MGGICLDWDCPDQFGWIGVGPAVVFGAQVGVSGSDALAVVATLVSFGKPGSLRTRYTNSPGPVRSRKRK